MKYAIPFTFLMALLLVSCIKDDFIFDTVEPELRITTAVDTLAIDDSFPLEAMYLNNIGVEEEVSFLWESLTPSIVSVDEQGVVRALQEGTAIIVVSYDNGSESLSDSIMIAVGVNTVITIENRSGVIQTTSSYLLEGDFEMSAQGGGVLLSVAANYRASTALPGLYLYLSNNPNSIANALEVGRVEVFAGAHTYQVPDTGINQYDYLVYFCKPFNVKVGDGLIE